MQDSATDVPIIIAPNAQRGPGSWKRVRKAAVELGLLQPRF